MHSIPKAKPLQLPRIRIFSQDISRPVDNADLVYLYAAIIDEAIENKKKKSLPRGIEPRSPALIGVNDKRKSSPLDQGRCDDRVYCSTTWLVDERKWLF
ncbi:hypothetical protein ACN38_g10899 [Penicillium nordicum]|uniref:Uncharacterized protein n=1 Tax=Penicillium nordicum TaxID=229535 RepID=A0A0M8NZN5_9EURO|nr:hypothetical protein ACN38_g10899 [Penicillium nordicum]